MHHCLHDLGCTGTKTPIYADTGETRYSTLTCDKSEKIYRKLKWQGKKYHARTSVQHDTAWKLKCPRCIAQNWSKEQLRIYHILLIHEIHKKTFFQGFWTWTWEFTFSGDWSFSKIFCRFYNTFRIHKAFFKFNKKKLWILLV